MLVSGRVLLGGPVPRAEPGADVAFAASGICSTYLGRVTLFAGIRRLGAARAAAIKNGMPVVTLVIEGAPVPEVEWRPPDSPSASRPSV